MDGPGWASSASPSRRVGARVNHVLAAIRRCAYRVFCTARQIVQSSTIPEKPIARRFRLRAEGTVGVTDELQTLGYYAPGTRPTIVDPIANASIGEATMVHEHVHQTLTINTTYGVFTLILDHLARQGHRIEEQRLFEEEQWDLHEAAATYCEMCLIARQHAERFDAAVRSLPSASSGDPAYRECFDFLNQLLPIDIKSPPSVLIAQSNAIVAMAACALNNDCLSRFAQPEHLDTRSAEAYLHQQSPNDRFQRIVAAVTSHPSCQELLGRHANASIGPLVSEIAQIMPDMSIVTTDEDFQTVTAQFVDAWATYLSSKGVHLQLSRVQSDPLAAIVDDPERLRRMRRQFAARQWTLNATIMREKLQQARRDRSGIMLALAMRVEEEVFLELLPFPLSDDGQNPAPGLDPLTHFIGNGGFLTGILPVGDVVSLLEEFQEFRTAATFYSSKTLMLWAAQTADRKCFDKTIVACVHSELSKESLEDVLIINRLRDTGRYYFMQLSAAQSAACFVNPQRAGLYAIVKTAGAGGMALLNALATQMGLEPFEPSAADIGPHTELLKLMALALIQEED